MDPHVAARFLPPFYRAPLLFAARCGYDECLDLLLEAGADTDMRGDNQGIQWITPLHCAAYFGHIQCVRSLLSHGADMHEEGSIRCNGRIVHTSSLCYACMAGYEDVALFLVQSGPRLTYRRFSELWVLPAGVDCKHQSLCSCCYRRGVAG